MHQKVISGRGGSRDTLGAHITKPTTDRQRPPPARHHRL